MEYPSAPQKGLFERGKYLKGLGLGILIDITPMVSVSFGQWRELSRRVMFPGLGHGRHEKGEH